MNITYTRLSREDIDRFRAMISLFGSVFEDPERYRTNDLTDSYISSFLADSNNHAIVALDNDTVVGALVAYELVKFEQPRRELFVYDVAVALDYHRNGIGTGLFRTLGNVARERGVYSIFVLAEQQDGGAVAFYRSIAREELAAQQFEIHF